MTKYRQKIFFSIFITAMLLFFTSTAIANAEETTPEEACSHNEKIGYKHKALRPHFNFYYQLLAEKYAPEHVKMWNEVVTERDTLIKKYKELKKDGKEIGPLYDETWLEEHSSIHQQLLEAVEKRDDEKLKEVVPKVIEHQKELNNLLKSRLKKIK